MKRNEEIAWLAREGDLSYDEIGKKFDLTRERVRQIAENEGVDLGARQKAKVERTKVEREETKRAEQEAELATRGRCRVCGMALRRKGLDTCSPRCAEGWKRLRFVIDPEEYRKHRWRLARTILRRPEKYPTLQVAWARRLLAGDPAAAEPNRRWITPRLRQLARELGIEHRLLAPTATPCQPSKPCVHSNQNGTLCRIRTTSEDEICWNHRLMLERAAERDT